MSKSFPSLLVTFALLAPATLVTAGELPSHEAVQKALRSVVGEKNGGFGLQMWATLVNRDGEVAVVAMSGQNRGDQWPGSRVISAQKANTANAFSLPGLAGPVHRPALLGRAARWQPVRPAGKQPGEYVPGENMLTPSLKGKVGGKCSGFPVPEPVSLERTAAQMIVWQCRACRRAYH
jgi:hypothetical protein